MKRIATLVTLSLCALALSPAAAIAQTTATTSASASAPTGADGPFLQKALEANMKGECPADLMAPALLAACQQQIAAIQPMLSAKGKITKLDFLGVESFPGGQAETWRVNYEHGTPQVWKIAVGADGKIAGMFSHDS